MIPRRYWQIFCRLAAATCLCSAMLLAVVARAARPDADSRNWYKGNTHAHSLWSDGDEFPEMVADWYKSHGYDFLAISDHDRLMAGEKWAPVDHGKRSTSSHVVEQCQKRFGPGWLEIRQQSGDRQVKLKTLAEVRARLAEPRKFLLIENEEITAKVGGHNVHLNAINLAEPIAPKTGRNVVDTLLLNLAAVKEQSLRLGRPILRK